MDRGYQSHKMFGLLQNENKHFVFGIKSKTIKTILEKHPVVSNSYVFEDSLALLGIPGVNQDPKTRSCCWI